MTTDDGLLLSGPKGLWEEGEGMRAELKVCTHVAIGSCHFLVISVTHTDTQSSHPQGPGPLSGRRRALVSVWCCKGFSFPYIRSLSVNFQFLSYQSSFAGPSSATSKHISGWWSTRHPFSPFLSQDAFIKVWSSLPLHIFEDVRILSVKIKFKWSLTCM